MDEIRRNTRERQAEPYPGSLGFDDWSGTPPVETAEAQSTWADPQERLSLRQFISELDQCLKRLPSRRARAFIMRNVLEQETAEICDELGITANHLFVMLHRANRGLRKALRARRAGISAGAGLLQPQA